jgi:hypothetical protein
MSHSHHIPTQYNSALVTEAEHAVAQQQSKLLSSVGDEVLRVVPATLVVKLQLEVLLFSFAGRGLVVPDVLRL